MDTVFQRAKSILACDVARERYGLTVKPGGKGCPCPGCGGDDRFFAFKDGQVACRKCHPKPMDAVELLVWREGLQAKEAAEHLVGGTVSVSGPKTRNRNSSERGPSWQAVTQRLIAESKANLPGSEGEQYLARRGLSSATSVAWHLGFDVRRAAIVIPSVDRGGIISAVKFRALDPEAKRRFWQEPGSAPGLCGKHLLRGLPLLVGVEGELNAASLWQALGDRADVVSFGSERNDQGFQMLAELAKGRDRVVIWADEEERVRALGRLIPKARMLKSPNGMDANDILREYGPDALTKVVLGEEQPEPPALAEYIGSGLWLRVGQLYERAKRMRTNPDAALYPSLVQAAQELASLLLDFDNAASTGRGNEWKETHRETIREVLARLAGEQVLTGSALLNATLEVFEDMIRVRPDNPSRSDS